MSRLLLSLLLPNVLLGAAYVALKHLLWPDITEVWPLGFGGMFSLFLIGFYAWKRRAKKSDNPTLEAKIFLLKTGTKFVISLFFLLFLYVHFDEARAQAMFLFLAAYLIFLITESYFGLPKNR